MNDTQDPHVAAAIREQLILTVEATPARRRSRQRPTATPSRGDTPTRWGTRRFSGLVATGVTVVIVLAASIIAITLPGRSGGPGPAAPDVGVPAPIEVDGKTIPYAGLVSWSDAVQEQADPRDITISASSSVMTPASRFCSIDQWRFTTVQTADSVTIEVQGYAVPLQPDAYCDDLGAAPPHTMHVTLAAPLGSRTLIDAATKTQQPVLDAADVPILAVLPSVYTQSVTWDQASGIATRTYADPERPTGGTVSLQTGTPAALAASGAVSGPPDASDISINGSPASLWSYKSADGDGRTWQIEWTDKDGHRMRIIAKQAASGQTAGSGVSFTKEEILVLARFVKSATPSTPPDTITHSPTPNG